jgi:hypothetical protein
MKKFIGLLFLVFAFGPVSAEVYVITADAETLKAADTVKKEMESRFDIYNRLFRFDPALLRSPLNVRVFGNRQAYDKYVSERLGETRQGAIYLHYQQPERRELVIHHGSHDEASIAHQAFVQFLRAFITNPPSWLLHGFAIYYSTLRFGPQGNPEYEENLLWLETVKKLGMLSPEAVLLADGQPLPSEIPDNNKILSWSMVSFLLNGNRDYFRNIVECFMLLSPELSASENTSLLTNHFAPRVDLAEFKTDFKHYLDSRKSYKEIMDDGQRAYSQGDFIGAELSFLAALDQRPLDYAPYYYLGLLAYEEKNYDLAELYYNKSRERGADEALINYALGLNAASAGRRDDAAIFLYKAAALDSPRFNARVRELLNKIR